MKLSMNSRYSAELWIRSLRARNSGKLEFCFLVRVCLENILLHVELRAGSF